MVLKELEDLDHLDQSVWTKGKCLVDSETQSHPSLTVELNWSDYSRALDHRANGIENPVWYLRVSECQSGQMGTRLRAKIGSVRGPGV